MDASSLRIKIPKGSADGLVSPTHTSPTLFKNLQLAFKNKQELKIASLEIRKYLYTGETAVVKETKVRFDKLHYF
jgi:hypothetical protein